MDARIYHLTTESTYLSDMRPHAEDVVLTTQDQLVSALTECFPDVEFSYLCVGVDLASFPAPKGFLQEAAQKLRPGGQAVFSFQNPYFAVLLHQMLRFSLSQPLMHILSPDHVVQWLRDNFSHAELTGASRPIRAWKLNDIMFGVPGKKWGLEVNLWNK